MPPLLFLDISAYPKTLQNPNKLDDSLEGPSLDFIMDSAVKNTSDTPYSPAVVRMGSRGGKSRLRKNKNRREAYAYSIPTSHTTKQKQNFNLATAQKQQQQQQQNTKEHIINKLAAHKVSMRYHKGWVEKLREGIHLQKYPDFTHPRTDIKMITKMSKPLVDNIHTAINNFQKAISTALLEHHKQTLTEEEKAIKILTNTFEKGYNNKTITEEIIPKAELRSLTHKFGR